ncbi:MAG: DUF4132 domain-containing protein [Planctomycetaceae bacterium]
MAKKKSTRSKSSAAKDGFQCSADSPLAAEHSLLTALVNEAEDSWQFQYVDLKKSVAGKEIAALEPEATCRLIAAAMERMEFADNRFEEHIVGKPEHVRWNRHHEEKWRWGAFSWKVVDDVLRKKLPLDEPLLLKLLEWGADKRLKNFNPHYVGIVKAAENFAAAQPLSDRLLKAATACSKQLVKRGRKDERRFIERLAVLLGKTAAVKLNPGEAWSDAVLADLKKMKAKPCEAWTQLLTHCATVEGGSPKARWLDNAKSLVDAVKLDEFESRIAAWFPLVDKPRSAPVERRHAWQPDQNLLLDDANADVLKGLVWCSAMSDTRDTARALTALALTAYKKVPGVGPRAVKVGNACVYALGAMPGMEGVGQLAMLKVKVKFGTAQKGIEKALNVTAERLGLPRDEIEEMAVPAYGLEDVGLRRETFGEYTAELRAASDGSTKLQWLKADGKSQKSEPAAVKKDHAEDLKELKAAAKDIAKMLPAQKERLDSLFLELKSWPFDVWRERYLDHPLVGVIARRLIWRFTTGKTVADGIWLDSANEIVGANDRPLKKLSDKTTVAPWHPIDQPVDAVLAWREVLARHEIVQPFKQAHREVYLLTDAERRTGVYSNRYAAHVLRQHQYNALCAARGWKNTLRLMVDDSYPPTMRRLPKWNLRAEFWVEGAGDEYGVDTNDVGTFLYLSTDQVRFYPLDAAQRTAHAGGGGYEPSYRGGPDEPLSLDQIPPLVFSEIMRDVDLFVGVASVGNDPTWSDGGPRGRYRDYWQSYSFGELTGTAQTRKTVLQRLIPRLKIADRCSFSDRFLIVRGDVRTYRIHLGSGNILMEPNDQYLCIVPRQSANRHEQVFLPFEGDSVLSIVLSKALLLADDTKITDKTILSQIQQ